MQTFGFTFSNKFARRIGSLRDLGFFVGFLSASLVVSQSVANGGGRFIQHRFAAQDKNQVEVVSLLRDLEVGTDSDRSAAREKLFVIGSASAENKRRIVGELLKEVSNPKRVRIKIAASEEQYSKFKAIVDILGRLRATEALDSLIKCLDCNDLSYGDSASIFPVQGAIARMGDVAIPWLERAMQTQPVSIRLRAATTLAMIGSDRARTSLQQAFVTESDELVKGTIQSSLNALGRRQ